MNARLSPYKNNVELVPSILWKTKEKMEESTLWGPKGLYHKADIHLLIYIIIISSTPRPWLPSQRQLSVLSDLLIQLFNFLYL